jgi:hypothetical protein
VLSFNTTVPGGNLESLRSWGDKGGGVKGRGGEKCGLVGQGRYGGSHVAAARLS